MRKWLRTPLVATIISAALLVVLVAPVSAAPAGKNTQISGEGVLHAFRLDAETPAFTTTCPQPDVEDHPEYAGFGDLTILLTDGNLRGCWYTLVEESKFSPSVDASPVVYQERGREVFIGDFYDDDGNWIGDGSFETTYKFTGKYTNSFLAVEIHGRCQHPLVDSSGLGVFDSATGRVDFKDDVVTGALYYRGHIRLANGA